MKLAGSADLISAYQRVMCLCEIGEHALSQFPQATLTLHEKHDAGATLFDGTTISITIYMGTLAALTPQEQCATLCHETFHFFHKCKDSAAYTLRTTMPVGAYPTWANYEEELTITGECPTVKDNQDGWDHKLFNENAVLRELECPPRTNYGGFRVQAAASSVKKKAVVIDFGKF